MTRAPDYNEKRRKRYAEDAEYRARTIRQSVETKQRKHGRPGSRLVSNEEYARLIAAATERDELMWAIRRHLFCYESFPTNLSDTLWARVQSCEENPTSPTPLQ